MALIPTLVGMEAHSWPAARLAQASMGSQGWRWVELGIEEEEKVRDYLWEAKIYCQFQWARNKRQNQEDLNKGRHCN